MKELTIFCVKALEELSAFVSQNTGTDWATNLKNVEVRLRASQKFIIPDNGKILDAIKPSDDILGIYKEYGTRLPYECVALEFRGTPDLDPDPALFNPEAFVVLAFNIVRPELPGVIDEGDLCVFSIYRHLGSWHPGTHLIRIKREGASCLAIPLDPICMQITQDRAIRDNMLEIAAVAELIAALSCKNVYIGDNDAPHALNEKRARRGKQPFFSYKTLHIKGESRTVNTTYMGGTHASPRVHLRRGHIRRLPQGKVWVSHCVVGSKSLGMVAKDYAVHA